MTRHAVGRSCGYLGGLALLTVVAFSMGAAHFEATECGETGGGECDLAALAGIVWAVVALAAGVLLVVVVELNRWLRRGRAAIDSSPHRA